MKIEKIYNYFLKECKKKFGNNLKTVLVFGSYAKNQATKESDIDFLIILENASEDIKERFDLFNKIKEKMFKKFKVIISPIVYKADEFDKTFINPLVYGILTGYKLIYDDGFWKNYLNAIKGIIKANNPIYIEGGKKWVIKKLI